MSSRRIALTADSPATQPGSSQREGRPPPTQAEIDIAHEIAALTAQRRREGVSSIKLLIEIDRRWPMLPFKVVLAAHFLDLVDAVEPVGSA